MRKILIVDDDNHIRRLYDEFFTRAGYRVYTAADETEVFKLVATEKFVAVILDIELEKTSGLSVMEHLKTDYPDIPVILNTAYTTYKSDFHTWLADAYFVKSSNLESLREKIEEIAAYDARTEQA